MMSYLRHTLGCCAVLLVPIACSESADDPQGTGGSSTSESGGSPAEGSGGSFASGGAGTGGQATGGDAPEGGGDGDLALEVDGWGTIRCKDLQADAGYLSCMAELPDGSTMRVLPRCVLDVYPEGIVGNEPNRLSCGEGPDELGDWDEIVCLEEDSFDEVICIGRRGDWAASIAPGCDVSRRLGEEIPSDDPRFISCVSDLSMWDEVRCFWDDYYGEVACRARRGLYWVKILADCRTEEPSTSWTEIDPATAGCDGDGYYYNYYDYYPED